MKITLKDGSQKEFQSEMTVLEIAKEISEGLARNACAAEVNGQVVDLRTVIHNDATVQLFTFEAEEGKRAYRHTASHILAQAVKRLYPDAKLAIGPSIESGFYYDFDYTPFDQSMLVALEQEMKRIIKEALPIERFSLQREEAIALMQKNGEPYKVQLIQELPEDAEISFYRQGEFVDLCAGPHLMNTKQVKAIKLLSCSGAYWKGSEKNKMLSRIYGTAYSKKSELEQHLVRLEEIKKRDHNKLGKEMQLFATVDVIGQGLPLLMPKGAWMIQTLQRWIEDEEEKRGYMRTKTPLLAKKDLYVISDHWGHYKEGMFVLGDEEKDEEVFALRPMTCPFQYYVYKQTQKSYRELPCRYGETSTLFRNEDSGEMHGLTRVRQFTISEGHVIVTREQIEEEFHACLDLAMYCLKTLGLEEDVTYRLSKWDPNHKEKYLGEEAQWEKTQQKMREILTNFGIQFTEEEGEAAFYGPKLDIQAKNVYGKEDTMITLQLDFALAERFDLFYIDQHGEKQRPFIIHRTSIGCYERTLAWLIEKYAGLFPTWLCPEQVRVLPISEKHHAYANEVAHKLKEHGIRCTVDERAEKIGYKIRESRLERVPYLFVVGQKEEDEQVVSVRSRYKGDEGARSLEEVIQELTEEIRTKKIRKIEIDQENN